MWGSAVSMWANVVNEIGGQNYDTDSRGTARGSYRPFQMSLDDYAAAMGVSARDVSEYNTAMFANPIMAERMIRVMAQNGPNDTYNIFSENDLAQSSAMSEIRARKSMANEMAGQGIRTRGMGAMNYLRQSRLMTDRNRVSQTRMGMARAGQSYADQYRRALMQQIMGNGQPFMPSLGQDVDASTRGHGEARSRAWDRGGDGRWTPAGITKGWM